MKNLHRLAGLPALLLAGCSAGLSDPLFSTGSQSIVASSDHASLYVANTDEGSLSVVNPTTGATSLVQVGKEPTRIARAAGRVYVTLRGERGIAVLAEQGGGLVMVGRIDTGAEPVGIVAREDGSKVYVALSQEDRVDEIDTASGTVSRSFAVDGHPSWLALHPSGDTLYVASAMGGTLYYLPLDTDAPSAQSLPFEEVVGAGEDGDLPFTHRLTGDPSFNAEGTTFGIPGLWVDNKTPVGKPDDGTISTGGGYGSVGMGLSRINPGVTLVNVDGHGRPQVDSSRNVFVGGFSTTSQLDGSVAVRSYLTGVTFSPDGSEIYAPMEGSQSVVVMSTTPVYADASLCSFCAVSSDTGGAMSPAAGGFAEAPTVFIGVGAGPNGVAFLDEDHAYVHTFLDRSVASLRASDAADSIAEQLQRGSSNNPSFLGGVPIVLTESALDPQVEEGRRLFFSAVTPSMAGSGSGVSCSTCHFEGRNDGLTWPLDVGARNTPSLAGKISETLPVTWTSQVDDVGSEADITSQGRMGGAGITASELDAIAAYVDWSRDVDVADKGVQNDATARGKALFEREDVGCASCHSGARLTDNDFHDLYGQVGVNTPGLVGIAATAPYLHDGSAATLRDVLESARGGEMGNTGALSDGEMDDLEAYLRSL